MEPTDRVVLDSSVILAFYSEIDQFHAEAVRAVGDLEQRISIVHPYVIQEVATLLTYRLGVEAAGQFLDDIRSATNVLIPAVDVEKDIAYFLRVNRKISFTDIALIRLAEEMEASLFTFDRQLRALFRRNK